VKPKPVSPYGVSKLAGEHLCQLYHKNFGVPVILLRYFTVYGPGQRPDMAFHIFIEKMLQGEELTLYGNGKQTRDFTFISDVVEANILAMKSKVSGEAFNIGGGSRIPLEEALAIMETHLGFGAKVVHSDMQKGDVRDTCADISKAKKMLGYSPKVGIDEGIRKEIDWIKGISA
jgi:nucleoside-diphosphate-sugar epimerase